MAEHLTPEARLVDRARGLAVIQDEQGYLAEAVIGADGIIRLVERNCAIHRVAADNGAACQAELELFREILGPDVERETHRRRRPLPPTASAAPARLERPRPTTRCGTREDRGRSAEASV